MKRRRKNKFVRKISKLFDRPKKQVSKPVKEEKKQEKKQIKPKFSVVEGKKSVIKKNRIIFGVVCVVLVVAFIIGNAVSPVSITESFSCMSAVSGGGDGFPVLIEEGSSKNLHYAHSQILTLTDTHLLSFNSNGKKVYQRLHGFANPVVSSSKGRTLIFDRGGKNYRIENAHETIFSGTIEQKIIAGAMSDCGNYVLVTESDKAVASATVFDKNDVALYRYNSSKDQILNVAISNNGEQVAVVTISSQNAEFVSQILILDDSAEVVANFKIKNQIAVFVDYTSNNKVRVVTNKNIYLFGDNKETEKTSFKRN